MEKVSLTALVHHRPRLKGRPLPLKVSERLKLVEVDGWVPSRTRGSHRQYRYPSKPGTVTIAGKPSDTLHPRTARSILRQAGRAEVAVSIGYVVIVDRDDAGGFSSWSPDLPGVVAPPAAMRSVEFMRDAVSFHLDGMREHGDPIPTPSAVGVETIVAA